jgi:hypothetical protein
MLAMPAEIVEAPLMRVAERIDADVLNPELGPYPIIQIVPRLDLGPNMHRDLSAVADRRIA